MMYAPNAGAAYQGVETGCLTPLPPTLLTGNGSGEQGQGSSGRQTPTDLAGLSTAPTSKVLYAKLAGLQMEQMVMARQSTPHEREDAEHKMPFRFPPGLDSADFVKIPIPACVSSADAVLPPPQPHAAPRPVRKASKEVKPMSVLQPEGTAERQVISRGSVGHPVNCAPACKYVKRKGGCRNGADCPNCHECFWCKSSDKEDVARTEKPVNEQETVKPLALAEPVVASAKAEAISLSVGTLGHPFKCGPACKYVRRKGGCMHGKNCVNCHSCQWRRGTAEKATAPEPAAGAKPAPALLNLDALVMMSEPVPILSTQPTVPSVAEIPMAALPEPAVGMEEFAQMPSSVGSIGHPYNCGPACKYVTKARGCKDGSACNHCHLCRWVRYGPKMLSL
eukprot:gb/GFBE01051895.1/.p1 GENE.gb/GFBE01051895.1/~~gb/GFBE01051895.1/.p1  ORF type:complete len:393 (+),score=84.43 gb/GFBE01051895.1/:1-1179(+)